MAETRQAMRTLQGRCGEANVVSDAIVRFDANFETNYGREHLRGGHCQAMRSSWHILRNTRITQKMLGARENYEHLVRGMLDILRSEGLWHQTGRDAIETSRS